MSEDEISALDRVYSAKSEGELADAYSAWAATYDRETLSAGYNLPFVVTAWLARHVPAGSGPILDAGCGTGLSGPVLSALGYTEIEGLDMAPRMLEIAATRNAYARLTQAQLGTPLPFADGRFAAILSTGVFTEGHAPASSVHELARILKPGGKAVLTVRDSIYEAKGFRAVFESLASDGTWREIERSPNYRAFAIDEPHVTVATYVFERL